MWFQSRGVAYVKVVNQGTKPISVSPPQFQFPYVTVFKVRLDVCYARIVYRIEGSTFELRTCRPFLVFLGLRGSAQSVPKFHFALRASVAALPELNSFYLLL